MAKRSPPKRDDVPKLNRQITAQLAKGDTPDTFGTRMAGLILDPAVSTLRVVSSTEGDQGVGEFIHADGFKAKLTADVEKIKDGDLGQIEEMLINQAISLQSVYTRMIEKAMNQSQIPAIDLFMRFGLRAQNQSRMTLETLSAVKNPPVVFAKQANISQGHQQINNNIPAHVEDKNAQNELLEQTHGERLDTRAKAASGRANTPLETVGAVHGSTI